MSHNQKPIVHFDFDGTIVEKLPKTNWRNWTKYPLNPLPGVLPFIEGLQESEDDGVPAINIGCVISRRPDAWGRRRTTTKSLSDAGLDEIFPSTHIRLCGNEVDKAKAVAASAESVVTGMIEDQPHKLVAHLVMGMLATGRVYKPIMVGVVDNPSAQSRVDVLERKLAEECHPVTIDRQESGLVISSFGTTGGSFTIDVTLLDPYSTQTGAVFAQKLLEYQFK
jgi:hypothetical protein